MPDVTASYGMPIDFIAFLGIFTVKISDIVENYSRLKCCISTPNYHKLCFDMTTCQKLLQVMLVSLILPF